MVAYASTTYTATCTTTATESREEPTLGASSGSSFGIDIDRARKRRRHSSYNPRSWSIERENLQLLVDRFLADLGRRLEMVETYGHLKIDEGRKYAFETLHNVHERCTHVGDDIMDAGKRRGKVLVETLESNYRGALATKETLEQKVQEGIKMCESMLVDFEKRAYDISTAGFSATAQDMLDSGIAYVGDTSSKAVEIVAEGAEAARRAKGQVQVAIEQAIVRARKHGLISYEHLPEPWKVNPHILQGYRFSETKLDCLRSCFQLSNELFNIWSHAIGLVLVLAVAFYFYPSTPAFYSATNFDILVAGCFFAAACKCLICSISWHTMSSISDQTLMERFACVDYTGISLLVATSIMTTEYTAFYCEPWSRWIYMSLTLVLGIAGTVLPWHPTFNRADMSWLRVGFFVSLAATGFIPILQLTIERGWNSTMALYSPILRSILVYLTGACLYASKFPERLFPGRFDWIGCRYVNSTYQARNVALLVLSTLRNNAFAETYNRCAVAKPDMFRSIL